MNILKIKNINFYFCIIYIDNSTMNNEKNYCWSTGYFLNKKANTINNIYKYII